MKTVDHRRMVHFVARMREGNDLVQCRHHADQNARHYYNNVERSHVGSRGKKNAGGNVSTACVEESLERTLVLYR